MSKRKYSSSTATPVRKRICSSLSTSNPPTPRPTPRDSGRSLNEEECLELIVALQRSDAPESVTVSKNPRRRVYKPREKYIVDDEAPFRLRLKFHELIYIATGDRGDQMVKEKVSLIMKEKATDKMFKSLSVEDQIESIRTELREKFQWFVAEDPDHKRMEEIYHSSKETNTSNTDHQLDQLTSVQSHESNIHTDRQLVGQLASAVQSLVTVSQSTDAKMEALATSTSRSFESTNTSIVGLRDSIAEVNERTNARLEEVNREANARIGALGDVIATICQQVHTLQVATDDNAKHIFNHAGRIENVEEAQAQMSQEQQRLGKIVRSILKKTSEDGSQRATPTDDAVPVSENEATFCKRFLIRLTRDSSAMNEELRQPIVSEKQESKIHKFVETVPYFLAKPYVGLVYRGADLDRSCIEKLQLLLADPKEHGRAFYRDNVILSASSTAFTAKSRPDFYEKNTHFVITSKSGRCVEKYAHKLFKHRDEVIFLPGTRFEITKLEAVGEKHVIYMRETSCCKN